MVANGMKIIAQCGLGNDVPQVGKGKTVATLDFVPSFGDVFEPCTIYPNDGCGHDGKIDVIDHSLCIAGLAFAASNVLLDLFETRFDFPSGPVLLDNLLNR